MPSESEEHLAVGLVPAAVAKDMVFLTQQTGVIPTLTRESADVLLIALENERVRLAARYRSATGAPLGAVVWVDGEMFPFHRDRNHFVDVWRHPDIMKGALLPVPEYDGRHVPAEIEHFTRVFSRRTGVPVSFGFDGRKWIIGIDVNESTGMRVFVLPMGKQRWGIGRDHSFQLVKDGQSVSDEFEGQLDRALKALTAPGDHGPAAESKTSESSAAAVNSVRERRNSVIRVL